MPSSQPLAITRSDVDTQWRSAMALRLSPATTTYLAPAAVGTEPSVADVAGDSLELSIVMSGALFSSAQAAAPTVRMAIVANALDPHRR